MLISDDSALILSTCWPAAPPGTYSDQRPTLVTITNGWLTDRTHEAPARIGAVHAGEPDSTDDGDGARVVVERSNDDTATPRPPRVFISYAHKPDSDSHKDLVRRLWLFLRSHGIDAHLDLVAAGQRQDWAVWMANQIRDADHILVIAPPAYRARAQGEPSAEIGRGCSGEARLIRDTFYRD